MKRILLFLTILIALNSYGQEELSSGIVYGKFGSYMVAPPKNWILDNQSGASQGLHCVFYPRGFNWANAPVIMYARMDSGLLKPFLDFTVREYKQTDPKFQSKLFKYRKAQDKYDCQIYDNYIGTYDSYERVAYIQVDSLICYVVFSSRTKSDFDQYVNALDEVVDKFLYLGTVVYKRRKSD